MIILRILFYITKTEAEIAVSTNLTFSELKRSLSQCFYHEMNDYSSIIDEETGRFYDLQNTIEQQGLENGDRIIIL